jgi:pimeloyl-ACP methyl ester carboxylesterase
MAGIHGAQVYYEVSGAGHPLLLLHAGIADSRMWDEQFHVFAKHFQVIRYDLRGYGRTIVQPGRFAYHEDVNGLLTFLGVERAHLAGISFGSRIALDFALAYPEKATALVLGAPSVSGNTPMEDVKKFVAEEEAALERGDLVGAAELNVRMWVDGPHRAPDQVAPAVRDRVREMQYHAFTLPVPDDVAVEPLAPPALARLAEVQAPTLIVIGDQDVAYVQATAGRLAAEIPGAEKVVLPGVAHMVSMERPEEFNRIVLEFLKRQTG